MSYKEAENISKIILTSIQNKKSSNSNFIVCLNHATKFIPTTWACIFGGYNFIPWSAQQASRNKESFLQGLSNLIETLDNSYILITNEEIYEFIRPAIKEIPTYLYSDLLKPSTTLIPKNKTHPLKPKSGEIIVSSSGTTGVPKLIRISYNTFLNRYYVPPNKLPTTNLIVDPLQSISGLAIILPKAKHTIYLQVDYFSIYPGKLFSIVEENKISTIGLSPYMMQMLIKHLTFKKIKYDLTSLNDIIIGSDLIDKNTIIKFRESIKKLTHIDYSFSFVYGMTECGPICYSKINNLCVQQHFSNDGIANIGTCLPSWSIRIYKDQSILQEGEVGQIEVISSDNLFTGYYGKSSALKNKEWFKTGDIGYIKNEHLYIIGRDKNTLVINSKKIMLESIENLIRNIPGIDGLNYYARKERSNNNLYDDLSIYYCPIDQKESTIRRIERDIKQIVSANFGIPIKNLVQLTSDGVTRTITGKKQRLDTIEEPSRMNNTLNKYIGFLWCDFLEKNDKPKQSDHFFAEGGDSLSLTGFVAEIEENYKIKLPIDKLLNNLTYSSICKLVTDITSLKNKADGHNAHYFENTNFENVKKIEMFMSTWNGERLYPNSIIVGRNTKGKYAPLIWVFQEYKEFDALANTLGEERPLYGLKSYSNILKVRDYTSASIQGLVDRYVWEILALDIKQPITLGGNCQGGMIALDIAKKLKKINKEPKILILMEWMIDFGNYNGKTVFLYGKNSHTAPIYLSNQPNIQWKEKFPNNEVFQIEGEHGQYFTKNNINHLSKRIKKYL